MLKIAICDDDPEVTNNIEKQIQRIAATNRIDMDVETWLNPESMCADFDNWGIPDLIFLDIELGKTNGMTVSDHIREGMGDRYTSIVFISGKSEYAVDLCRMEPFDFLIKPIKEERLEETIAAYLRKHERDNAVFEFSSHRCFHRVLFKEIMYFTSDNKKIILTLYDSKTIEFSGKLNDISKTAPHNFIRISHSCLLNYDYIASCRYENILMRSGGILEISRNYRSKVREFLAQRRWDR